MIIEIIGVIVGGAAWWEAKKANNKKDIDLLRNDINKLNNQLVEIYACLMGEKNDRKEKECRMNHSSMEALREMKKLREENTKKFPNNL